MRFPEAAKASGLADALREGLKAVKNCDRGRLSGGRGLSGSIDLDEALKETLPVERRWDYLIGRKLGRQGDHLHCVEVHRADVGEVRAMIGKKASLDGFLRGKRLAELPRSYHWIATDGHVCFPASAREARQLAQAGILAPKRKLELN